MQTLFENRTYRSAISDDGLLRFSVSVKETNLFIRAPVKMEREALDIVANARFSIERYIAERSEFATSLIPIDDDEFAPPIIREMMRDARIAGVGPMAGVAGAIAELVARRLREALQGGGDVIVENGGDIFLISTDERIVRLFVPGSDYRLGISIRDAKDGIGISSSSATIGYSLSLGRCDLATVIAKRGALSDATATALGNSVLNKNEIGRALDDIVSLEGVLGGIVIAQGVVGVKGDVRLISL